MIVIVHTQHNAGDFLQICAAKIRKFCCYGLISTGGKITAYQSSLFYTLCIQIEQLDTDPGMAICSLHIHRNSIVCANVYRRDKADTNFRPSNGMLCPDVNGIGTAVGVGLGNFIAGIAAKAFGCENTGCQNIVRIQAGSKFLIGIMHQSIHINGITRRNVNTHTNDLAAITLEIALNQACRNTAVIPAAAQGFENKVNFLGSVPQLVVYTQTCLRLLRSKIEICMQCTLGQIGQRFCRAVQNSILRCPGNRTNLILRSNDLHGADTTACLLVLGSQFG